MNVPISIMRPFNAFGPYQSTRVVIAEMILTCLDNGPIYSAESKQTLEFKFVENLVDGILLVGVTDAAVGQIINIGAAEEIAISDLIKTIRREAGSSSELHIGALENRPAEVWRMRADNEKARNLLDWTPQIDLIDGLCTIIDWLRAFRRKFETLGQGLSELAVSATGASR